MLTEEQYTLFTGLSVSYDSTDWTTLVTVASMRLATFLCLDEFPELDDDNLDLAELLANFMAGVFKYQGGADEVDSKSVRNFTIKFKSSSASTAFAQIAEQYGDIIEKYSECDSGVVVEKSRNGCCYGCF